MLGFPDGAYANAYDGFFSELLSYEEEQQLRDELNDGTAEEYCYDPDELDPEELETLIDYRTL